MGWVPWCCSTLSSRQGVRECVSVSTCLGLPVCLYLCLFDSVSIRMSLFCVSASASKIWAPFCPGSLPTSLQFLFKTRCLLTLLAVEQWYKYMHCHQDSVDPPELFFLITPAQGMHISKTQYVCVRPEPVKLRNASGSGWVKTRLYAGFVWFKQCVNNQSLHTGWSSLQQHYRLSV